VDKIGHLATIGAAVDKIGGTDTAVLHGAPGATPAPATIGAAVGQIRNNENIAPPGFIRPSLPSRIYPEAVFIPVSGSIFT
jgi:hypothetical protein